MKLPEIQSIAYLNNFCFHIQLKASTLASSHILQSCFLLFWSKTVSSSSNVQSRQAELLASMHTRREKLTSVIVFRAVSAPMLKSEPGTLLDTVAGTIAMGIQNSSYFSRAAESSKSPRYAWWARRIRGNKKRTRLKLKPHEWV